MSGGPSRCLRLVMPLRLGLELFDKASTDKFLHSGVLSTPLEQLSKKDRISRVLWLRENSKEGPLCDFLDTHAVWSTFELSCDFTQSMHRIQLNSLGRRGRSREEWIEAGRRFLEQVRNVLQQEKIRQMQADELPSARLPWRVQDDMSMPVVFWIRTHNSG